MIEHDVTPGELYHCQITGSTELFPVIDLGHQPPCDSMLTVDQLDQPELTYPLRLNLCPSSGLAQLDYVVPATTVYPPSYPYRSSVSTALVAYQRAMASSLFTEFRPTRVLDIGSNDGTLLKAFKDLGCDVYGIEPTDIAKFAAADGVPTIQSPFSALLAEHLSYQV
jgi:hypothetical protein